MDNIPTPIAAILVLIGGVYLIWKWVESGERQANQRDKVTSK